MAPSPLERWPRPALELRRLLAGEALAEAPDFPPLLALARRHALLQLLEAPLAAWAPPPDASAALRAARRGVLVRNIYHRQNGTVALAALARERIPVLLLKGMALLCGGYWADEERYCADVDLLLPEADPARADRALRQAGLVPLKARAGINAWVREELGQWAYRGFNGQVLEVHWRLAGRASAYPTAPCWSAARQRPLGNQTALLPAPLELAGHLIFHAVDQHSAHPLLQWRTALDLERILAPLGPAAAEPLLARLAPILPRPEICGYLHFLAAILPAPSLARFAAALPPGPQAIYWERFLPSLEADYAPPPAEPSIALEKGIREKSPRRLLRILCPPAGQMSYLHDLPLTHPRLWWKYLQRPFYLWGKMDGRLLRWAFRSGVHKRRWEKER